MEKYFIEKLKALRQLFVSRMLPIFLSDAVDFAEWLKHNASSTGFPDKWVYFAGKGKYNETKTTKELYRMFRKNR